VNAPSDKERRHILARVLERFSTAYNKEFDEDKIRLWYGQIGHLNAEAALATADACISHHKWLPTISEYLEISRTVRRQQEDAKREAPRALSPALKELQDKGLHIQRDLVSGRAQAGLKHDHQKGWEGCPVCSQAAEEVHEDSCRTCMLLEDRGIKVIHS